VSDRRQSPAVGDPPLAVSSRRVRNGVVVSLAGDLDMLTAPQLVPAVEGCLDDGSCELLVVDLRPVEFLGSAGLGALLDVQELAGARGLPLRVVAGENRHVLRPFEITGLTQVVHLHHDVDEALSTAPGDGR
jgi:anti-sigma B factor antagonist